MRWWRRKKPIVEDRRVWPIHDIRPAYDPEIGRTDQLINDVEQRLNELQEQQQTHARLVAERETLTDRRFDDEK